MPHDTKPKSPNQDNVTAPDRGACDMPSAFLDALRDGRIPESLQELPLVLQNYLALQALCVRLGFDEDAFRLVVTKPNTLPLARGAEEGWLVGGVSTPHGLFGRLLGVALSNHQVWLQVAVEVWNRTDQGQRNAFIQASPFWEPKAILDWILALHAHGVAVPLVPELDSNASALAAILRWDPD